MSDALPEVRRVAANADEQRHRQIRRLLERPIENRLRLFGEAAVEHVAGNADDGHPRRVRTEPEASADRIAANPAGTAPVVVDAKVGTPVTLDAAGTYDPDGNELSYTWFHYLEAGFGTAPALAALALDRNDGPRITVTPTATCRPQWLPTGPCPATGVAHIILAVTDNGSPSLTSYRRVIFNVHE